MECLNAILTIILAHRLLIFSKIFMNKNTITNILLIGVIIILVVIVITSLTLTWQGNQEKSINPFDNFEAKYGLLTLPIKYNLKNSIQWKPLNDDLNVNISDIVYKIDFNHGFVATQKLASKISNNLNLNTKEASADTLIFFNDSTYESLEFNKNIKTIHVSLNSKNTKQASVSFDTQDAELQAQTQLELIELWPFEDLEEDKDYRVQFRYFKIVGNNYIEATDNEEVDLVQVVYTSLLDQKFPITKSRIKSGEIEVLLNASYEIVKIDYQYLPVEESSTYPIIDQAEALDAAKNGRAELITTFESEIPTSLDIKDVAFTYQTTYQNPTYLQPVYIFEGIDNNDNLTSIIVPAVDPEYLL